jgi:murein DD-endopeptidase MepM/ murein hydrolase activator NlpD
MGMGRAVRVAAAVVVAAAVGVVDVGRAGAVVDGGGRVVPSTSSVTSPRYEPPVDAVVVDPFRLPLGHYGPGNRGLEYRTVPGTPVRSIGDGRVAFAGLVAGRLVVSIDHPDGLRSSLVGLGAISVRAGQRVSMGDVVGSAGPTLHLGVRRNGRYLDPSTLFARRGPARLVPVPR